MNQFPRYWKAAVGFVVPGVVILAAGITAGSDGGATITQTEWLTALFACILTSGGVAAKGNGNPQPTGPQDPEA